MDPIWQISETQLQLSFIQRLRLDCRVTVMLIQAHLRLGERRQWIAVEIVESNKIGMQEIWTPSGIDFPEDIHFVVVLTLEVPKDEEICMLRQIGCGSTEASSQTARTIVVQCRVRWTPFMRFKSRVGGPRHIEEHDARRHLCDTWTMLE